MLQYYITIIAYTQHYIGYGRFIRNLGKLYSRHMNFYCKKMTQVEVRYRLLNVAQYVSCKVVLYFFMFTWELEVLWQLSSQNEVNTFILLEVNCKINSLRSAKSLILYINDVMERYFI